MDADLGIVDSPTAVATFRRLLAAQLDGWGVSELTDDAVLVLSELVTNALLHGAPPIRVGAARLPGGVRVEVLDGAQRAPDPQCAGPDDTIGRGMEMVAALGTSWGWHPTSGGKIVWCELSAPEASSAPGGGGTRTPERGRPAGVVATGPPAVRLWPVRVPDVPVHLLAEHVTHVEGQLRELKLIQDGGPEALAALGSRLEPFMRDYDSRPGLLAQLRVAQAAGRPSFALTLELPLSAVDSCQEYLAVLDEVDAICRAEQLLALESPPHLRELRRWLIAELTSGVQRAAGLPAPDPVPMPAGPARPGDQPARPGDRLGEQPRQLQSISLALAATDTLHDAAAVLLRELPPLFQALRAGVFVVSEDGSALVAVQISSSGKYEVRESYAMPMTSEQPSTASARAGTFLEILGREEMLRRFPLLPGPSLLPEEQAWWMVPLSADGVVVGLVALTGTEPKALRGDERRLLQDVAEHAAQAVNRARRFERDQRIAQALQSSLLDTIPGEIAGLHVATRYQPAQSYQMVGGDWHDVFALAPTTAAVTVGDVCGHGVEAAAVMGRVRSALAAIAQDEPSPGRVLAKVNRMLCRLGDATLDGGESRYRNTELLATALHGRLDRRSLTFRYAVAGHPGPVITDLHARSARLDHPAPNLPLGIEPSTRYDEQVLHLPAHGSLLAFTDGLFERRDESLDTRLDALVARAGALAGRPVQDVADALLDGVTADNRTGDDVALVVFGW